MKLTAHKTEAVYRRYTIVCEADLADGLKKLVALGEFQVASRQATQEGLSHSLATVPTEKTQIAWEKLAEGARFELADELPHLRFSRPARSATPSPLHTLLAPTGSPCR